MNGNSIKINPFMLLLKKISELYSAMVSKAAAECCISKQEADVLCFLTNNPQYDTARDISEYRGFSRAYISKAVELLADKGFIDITIDTDDRRFQHLSISEKAEFAVKHLMHMQQQFISILKNNIDDADINLLESIMFRVTQNVSSAYDNLPASYSFE